MTNEVSTEAKQEITEAIFTRNKIHAIKLYREATDEHAIGQLHVSVGAGHSSAVGRVLEKQAVCE